MEPSAQTVKRLKARDIFHALMRETMNTAPAGSLARANPALLGFADRQDRTELVARHRQGLQQLRQSREVTLAYGHLVNLLAGPGAMPAGANATAWHSSVEPVLRRGSERFGPDRAAGILALVEDVSALIEQRYGASALPFAVAIELTRASVAAYGYGFFIGYNVLQTQNSSVESTSEERNEESTMSRVALVTGGTRGIGAAVSKALKAAGYKVAANYAGNDEAAQKFKAETGIPVFKWDVSSFEACAAGVKQVEAELGPVDILVNNAGITRDSQLHRMKPEQWTAVINTNLSSIFNMCRNVIEGMRERKFGRIVNVSSINGQKGQFGQVNYSAAKAGEIGFTKALAQEGARVGITVNAIAPGYINTEMVQAVPKEVLEKNILPQIPIGRLGEPEEVARCVVFLVADDAGLITGSTLTANGGQYFV